MRRTRSQKRKQMIKQLHQLYIIVTLHVSHTECGGQRRARNLKHLHQTIYYKRAKYQIALLIANWLKHHKLITQLKQFHQMTKKVESSLLIEAS